MRGDRGSGSTDITPIPRTNPHQSRPIHPIRNVKSGGNLTRVPKRAVYAALIHRIVSNFGAVLKSVLVALDRSALSESAMAMLRSLNLNDQSNVILVHVIPPLGNDLDAGLDRPHTAAPDLYRDIETHLEAYQKRLPCPSAIEITCGEPAAEIVRLANIHQADLIILGSRGLSGIDRILQGSVSSEVLEQAPCSVLVVKAKATA